MHFNTSSRFHDCSGCRCLGKNEGSPSSCWLYEYPHPARSRCPGIFPRSDSHATGSALLPRYCVPKRHSSVSFCMVRRARVWWNGPTCPRNVLRLWTVFTSREEFNAQLSSTWLVSHRASKTSFLPTKPHSPPDVEGPVTTRRCDEGRRGHSSTIADSPFLAHPNLTDRAACLDFLLRGDRVCAREHAGPEREAPAGRPGSGPCLHG
jgi:hypothetical protein